MVEIVHKPASNFSLWGWGSDEYCLVGSNGSFIRDFG